jgi:hypothetical protein
MNQASNYSENRWVRISSNIELILDWSCNRRRFVFRDGSLAGRTGYIVVMFRLVAWLSLGDG